MMTEQAFMDFVTDRLEANFPKGKCQERGKALVLIAEIKLELVRNGIIAV
jgi:hypothetical protein